MERDEWLIGPCTILAVFRGRLAWVISTFWFSDTEIALTRGE
jgi:hypothetical protein